jgi:hypothetical protein
VEFGTSYVYVCGFCDVLIVCVLVFSVFCVVCTVFFLYCLFYVYVFLLVFSVLPPSDNSIAVNNNNNNNNNNMYWPVPVTASSKALVCGRSPAENPTGGVDVFVYCECCTLSGKGLCDGLITRPEESY